MRCQGMIWCFEGQEKIVGGHVSHYLLPRHHPYLVVPPQAVGQSLTQYRSTYINNGSPFPARVRLSILAKTKRTRVSMQSIPKYALLTRQLQEPCLLVVTLYRPTTCFYLSVCLSLSQDHFSGIVFFSHWFTNIIMIFYRPLIFILNHYLNPS